MDDDKGDAPPGREVDGDPLGGRRHRREVGPEHDRAFVAIGRGGGNRPDVAHWQTVVREASQAQVPDGPLNPAVRHDRPKLR